MIKQFLSQTFLTICLFGISIIANTQNTPAQKISSVKFTEGIVYSKASFPGHPVNEAFKKVDFESGDFTDLNNVIEELKKYQKSIQGMQEQDIKDTYFASAITFLPVYSKMYFTPSKALIESYALGFRQQTLISNTEHSGKMVLNDREKENSVTITFKTDDLKEVWQKYQVNAEQYSIQKTNETTMIAGYPCKKMIYTFGGTSRGLPVTNYVINTEPKKVTIWYSDDLPPAINSMHNLYFELDKAVLKYEVEFDKNQKNKMLVEVTGLTPQKLEDEKFELKDVLPVIEHTKGNFDAGMRIMQVMMSAIGLLTK